MRAALIFYCLIGSHAALDTGEIVGIAVGGVAGVGLAGSTVAAAVRANDKEPATEAPGYEEPLTDAPAVTSAPAQWGTTLPPLRVVNAKEENGSSKGWLIAGAVLGLGVLGLAGAGIAYKRAAGNVEEH